MHVSESFVLCQENRSSLAGVQLMCMATNAPADLLRDQTFLCTGSAFAFAS